MISPVLIVLFLFVSFAGALLAVTLAWAMQQTLLSEARKPEESGEAGPALIREDDLSSIRIWAKLLDRISHVETLRKHLEESGLEWSVGRVTLLMLLTGSVAAALLLQIPEMPGFLAVVGFVMAAGIPYAHVMGRRQKRFDLFAAQFPDAMDSLARGLQAGFPLAVCLESLVQEQPEPLASELKRARDERRLGLGWDHAMDGLSARIPISEVKLFAAAVKMQSRTGGRLNIVLGQLGENLREASALDGEVRALSANSRISGSVLTILPFGIGLLLFMTNPEYVVEFMRHPTGRLAVMLAVAANVAAHFVIRRMCRIEV